jgi:hypothetical protein
MSMPPPDATVAIIPEEVADPGATVVDASFLPDALQQGSDPVGFAFGDDEMPVPPAEAFVDPAVSDSLAISSSDLLEPQPRAPVATSDGPSVTEAIMAPEEPLYAGEADPLLADQALDVGASLPDLASQPLGDSFDFATPLDDPMEATAGGGNSMPEMPAPPMPPTPEPVGAEPYSAEPFAEPMPEIISEPIAAPTPAPIAAPIPAPIPAPIAQPIEQPIATPSVNEPVRPESFRAEAPTPEPPIAQPVPSPAPDLTTLMPAEPEPAPQPTPVAEVPVVSEPAPAPELPVSMEPIAEPIEALPEPEPEPAPVSLPEPIGLEPLMADSEPLMAPEMPLAAAPAESISADAVNRIVEEVTPALREELHQTLERVAWESFGAVTEQLVAQAVERIETIAWEVVPKLAETLIQEEIRKLKERS